MIAATVTEAADLDSGSGQLSTLVALPALWTLL